MTSSKHFHRKICKNKTFRGGLMKKIQRDVKKKRNGGKIIRPCNIRQA